MTRASRAGTLVGERSPMNTPLRPSRAAPAIPAAGLIAAVDKPWAKWGALVAILLAIGAGAIAALKLAGGGLAAQRAITTVVEQADRLSRGEPVAGGDPVAAPAIEALERVAEK